MIEDSSPTKRIAIVIITLLSCAIVAWALCSGIAKFYNSGHLFLAGIVIAIETVILYLLIKKMNIMGNLNQMVIGNPEKRNPSSKLDGKYSEEEINKLIDKLVKNSKGERVGVLKDLMKVDLIAIIIDLIDKLTQKEKEVELLKKDIKENYVSKESHDSDIEELKEKIKKEYVPLAEYIKLERYKRMYDKLIGKTEKLLEEYVLYDVDDASMVSKELLEKLKVYYDLVHYDNDNEKYFEEVLVRPRKESDPQDVDKIETIPALFIKNECIIKGKYVKLTD